MTRPWLMAACLALCPALSRFANAAAYVGAGACRPCHAAIFESQSASPHAAALSPVSDIQKSMVTGITIQRKPSYQVQILNSGGDLRVHITDGTDLMDLPLEWAFGAGRQARTFVTRVNGQWYLEHYASWYSATQSYGPTPGQQGLIPKTISEAAGVLYSIADPSFGIKGCFECHATGPVSFGDNGEVQVREHGVRCENCHGPGSDHTTDPKRHKLVNPTQLTSAKLNDFCGRCHRPSSAASLDWNNSWNVRHQPVYFSQSRCFQKSGGRLSCLTCHDPHEAGGSKPADSFNARCVGCHAGASAVARTACTEKGRTNCIDCHMPLVSPQPPLRFTNHWIGIYGAGAKLKPIG